MKTRVMIASDFSTYRQMTGVVIAEGHGQRLVRLDALTDHSMVFDLRELVWLC